MMSSSFLDKEDLVICDELYNLDQEILNKTKHFHDKYVGRYGKIITGWHKGEKGSVVIIDSVMFEKGHLWFLCMAVNKKLEKTNWDEYTRTYRPATDIELLGK